MRYPYNNIYNQFIQQSQVPLQPKLSPKAFSRNGDQFIMVFDPSFPAIGNCRYYQSLANLNSHQRSKLAEKAKALGLATIPALNIDLPKKFKKSFKHRINLDFCSIDLKVSLNGNAKIVCQKDLNHPWVHTGKDKHRGSLKIFETEMTGHWNFSVIVTTKAGVMLRMKHTDGLGGTLQFQGSIRKNKASDGLVATLFLVDTGTKKMVKVGPLFVGGNFGFKVEITGEWKKWELNDYFLPEDYKEYIDLLDSHEEFSSIGHVQHAHIMIPYKAEVMAGVASTMAMLSRWYMNIQPIIGEVGAELASPPPIIA